MFELQLPYSGDYAIVCQNKEPCARYRIPSPKLLDRDAPDISPNNASYWQCSRLSRRTWW